MSVKRWSAMGLIAASLAAPPAGASETERRERVGYAYDPGTGQLLYTETHNELVRDGEVIADMVIYRDAAGAVFAEKRVDFTSHLTMPDFHLRNVANGHVERAEKKTSELEVSFRKLRGEETRRTLLDLPRRGIVDAGFDRMIEKHWESLRDGEALVRDFLIPSQLGFYAFRIKRAPDSETAGEVVFRMEMDSMLIRLFVPPVVVSYDASTRRLLRYEGVSNIRNERGENYKVRIEFPRGPGGPTHESAAARGTRVAHEPAPARTPPALRAP